MNTVQFSQAISQIRAGFELLQEAVSGITQEPLLNKSKLAKACGVGRTRIAELMRTGQVPTYEEGTKAKASDIIRALQDRPHVSRAGRTRKVGNYSWKVI